MKEAPVVSKSEGSVQSSSSRGAHRRLRQGYVLASVLLAVAVLIQVFLAGSGLFGEPSWWSTHRMFGMMLSLGPLVLLALGLAARLPLRTLMLTGLLLVLFGLQPFLILGPGLSELPELKALHVVNAVLIFALTAMLGQQVWRRLALANERLAR
jgi:hypothetical protein